MYLFTIVNDFYYNDNIKYTVFRFIQEIIKILAKFIICCFLFKIIFCAQVFKILSLFYLGPESQINKLVTETNIIL